MLKPTNEELETELARLGRAWQLTWAAASELRVKDRLLLLETALATFFEQQLAGSPATPERLAFMLLAVRREQTHTNAAIDAAMEQMARKIAQTVKGNRLIWTRPRRIAAAILAVWWAAVLAWYIISEHTRYYEAVQATDLALIVPLFVAFTYGAYRWATRD